MHLPSPTRRQFLRSATAATLAAAALRGTRASATPLGLPLGLQLYSVREQLAIIHKATLEQTGSLLNRRGKDAGDI